MSTDAHHDKNHPAGKWPTYAGRRVATFDITAVARAQLTDYRANSNNWLTAWKDTMDAFLGSKTPKDECGKHSRCLDWSRDFSFET
jgi:hypothetical protein